MLKLIKMNDGRWAVVGDKIDFKGTLDECREMIQGYFAKRNLEIFGREVNLAQELDTAIRTMRYHQHNVAEFGLAGHFIYSSGEESRLVA